MSKRARNAAASLPLLLSACSYQTYQSMLGGAAIEDRQFQVLFWIFLLVCTLMYLLVIGFLIGGTVRARRRRDNAVESGSHDPGTPLMRTALIGWSVLIGVGLAALAVASFFTDRLMAKAAAQPRLSVSVTANQYWWDIQYDSADPSHVVRTANELHLPEGVPVRLALRSRDVIHSLWIPSLSGKEDLIPGRESTLNITPARTGLFRGQCAEFCGAQHAHMALVVSVDNAADFARWRVGQTQPARVPVDPLAAAGFRIVTTGQCASCHAVAGTRARGQAGPDLTHLASRRSVAAGMLPMSRGNLYGWVADAPALKPGTGMPQSGLEPDQLHAVVAYLETLK